MANFDIFAPTISTVSKGINGKLFLIHSNERKLGKTAQACRFPKPYYLRFEQGINAIAGLPYAALNSWSDFKKVNKRLTNPATLDKALETYTTIIVDTLDVAIKWCDKYVCNAHGVERLNDGNSGYGLWKEYENEWFNEWNKLLNAGYAVIFISHSEDCKMKHPITGAEYVQLRPKGDKRTIDLIIDAADFIGYVKSNGFDEEGNALKSSIYFSACPEFLAGSRFTYMKPEITPFTAEAVMKAVEEAVEEEEKATGIKGTTFTERKNAEPTEMTYEEIMDKLRDAFKKARAVDADKTRAIIDKYLGEDAKLSEATEGQMEQLSMVLDEFNEMI